MHKTRGDLSQNRRKKRCEKSGQDGEQRIQWQRQEITYEKRIGYKEGRQNGFERRKNKVKKTTNELMHPPHPEGYPFLR